MTLTLRAEKGTTLTAQEVDQNFEELEGRLLRLEEDVFQPDTFQDITQQGNQIVIHSTSGKTFGPFHLQVSPFSIKGRWTKQTSYQPNDFAQNKETLYVCTQKHTSDETFAQDLENGYWQTCFKAPTHSENNPSRE
ncbi:MAG: hypothetical protein V6Z78_01480 [Holosporaceae bacterium]